MNNEDDVEYLIMKKQFGKHPMETLAFQDEGAWRAVLQCVLCERHTVFPQIDPSDINNESMTMLHAEMQMHASDIGDRMDDGWHEGLGFSEIED